VVAGLAPDFREPGMFTALVSGGIAVLVVRGEDGELRAFTNTCRHGDAFVLAERDAPGQRTAGAFTCPFADWPDAHADGGTAVRPLPVAAVHGVVFVQPGAGISGAFDPGPRLDPGAAGWLDRLGLDAYERTGTAREVDARHAQRVAGGFRTLPGAHPIGALAALVADTVAGTDVVLLRAFPLVRGGSVVDTQRYSLRA
jgi:phenylpropionate dioxygenase-like ring-hydroxylating dioxygenase large terminal subunit